LAEINSEKNRFIRKKSDPLRRPLLTVLLQKKQFRQQHLFPGLLSFFRSCFRPRYPGSRFFLGGPVVFTWSVQFIYQGSNAWPSSYTYYQSSLGYSVPPLDYYSGYHLLSDDSDNRIIKDTCLNGTGNVFYFSYPNNEIVITAGESASIGGYTNTLFISNGNISQEASYTPSIPSTVLPANFIYAPVANPGYHPLISYYIGPLLNVLNTSSGTIVDFISKNAWQGSSQSEGPSGPVSSTSYTLETDNKGRLVKMTLTSFPVTWNTVLFSYY
jgi:hypothetical protein